MYFTNNGEGTQEALKKFHVEAGVLAEWNGKEWKVVRRNQFVEVTGPGGIYGNTNPETDPIWATGWDYKSVILGVRDAEKGGLFIVCPKPVIVMMVRMDGIQNGRVFGMSGQSLNLII